MELRNFELIDWRTEIEACVKRSKHVKNIIYIFSFFRSEKHILFFIYIFFFNFFMVHSMFFFSKLGVEWWGLLVVKKLIPYVKKRSEKEIDKSCSQSERSIHSVYAHLKISTNLIGWFFFVPIVCEVRTIKKNKKENIFKKVSFFSSSSMD